MSLKKGSQDIAGGGYNELLDKIQQLEYKVNRNINESGNIVADKVEFDDGKILSSSVSKIIGSGNPVEFSKKIEPFKIIRYEAVILSSGNTGIKIRFNGAEDSEITEVSSLFEMVQSGTLNGVPTSENGRIGVCGASRRTVLSGYIYGAGSEIVTQFKSFCADTYPRILQGVQYTRGVVSGGYIGKIELYPEIAGSITSMRATYWCDY